MTTILDDPDGKAVMLLTKKFDCEPIIYFLDEVILYLLKGLSVKVPMKRKIIAAYLNALKKYNKMVFYFLAYLFSFSRY